FFDNNVSTTEIYTLSLHDALPIFVLRGLASSGKRMPGKVYSAVVRGLKSLTSRAKEWELPFSDSKALVSQLARVRLRSPGQGFRSEEHTSELQSRGHLVFSLLLQK